jgi:hypothetical protein
MIPDTLSVLLFLRRLLFSFVALCYIRLLRVAFVCCAAVYPCFLPVHLPTKLKPPWHVIPRDTICTRQT